MYSDQEMKENMKILEKCIEKIYFWYMTTPCDCGTCGIENLVVQLVGVIGEMASHIHDKYADHVENLRK
jgi:hypothetical protein